MCNSSFRGGFGEERSVQKLKRAVGGGADGRAHRAQTGKGLVGVCGDKTVAKWEV